MHATIFVIPVDAETAMSRSPCTAARSILFASTALLFAMMPPAFAQSPPDVGAVLRSVAGHFPELIPARVRQSMPPSQNNWSALSPILYISVEVTGSPEEAEWKLHRSFVSVSVANDREQVFNGKALYVWETYGMRLSYQTGPYVIHISSRDGDPRVGINEPLAIDVLERLVGELESVRPERQVLRAREVALNSTLDSSWGLQGAHFRESNFEILPWEDAEFILAERELQGGRQYQTRWLTIFCPDGESFLTRQPELDAYVQWGKAKDLDLSGFATE